jgi:S-adenosylmethionine hydrolase
MSIITLTTDFGLKDHFVGALKGKILSKYPEVQIIDISHDIDLFNIAEASYIIKSTYKCFPEGTVHLIGVDSEKTATNQHVVAFYNGHYFVCTDNGILSLLFQKEKPQALIEIAITDRLPSNTSDLDILLQASCHVAKGGALNAIGTEKEQLQSINEIQANIEADKNSIKGNIIYIDHFGNCVTNITQEMFYDIGNDRNFEIKFGNQTIKKIHLSYSDFTLRENYTLKDYEGEKLALFNEAGLLEIAIYKSNPNTVGSASSLLGLKYRDVVSIDFKI